MNTSDWIGIICAAFSLVVTVIIAILQIKQSNRMEKFERRQDERDERRHAEEVKAQAVSFVSNYYDDRGLVPLCAMAVMYNDLFCYSRKMYRDFCCYTLEVQNKILEYCGFDLCISSEKDIFPQCVKRIDKIRRERFPKDINVFYGNGKYIERSLIRYGKESIPNNDFSYVNNLTGILADAFNSNDTSAKPIETISKQYSFKSSSEIKACQMVTTIAEYIAVNENRLDECDKDYGSPGSYAGETIDTMEDLFLLSLFEMYTRLILK